MQVHSTDVVCFNVSTHPYGVGCDHTIAKLHVLAMNNRYDFGMEHGYNLCVSYVWSVYVSNVPIDLVLEDLPQVSARRPAGVVELQTISEAAMPRPVQIRR